MKVRSKNGKRLDAALAVVVTLSFLWAQTKAYAAPAARAVINTGTNGQATATAAPQRGGPAGGPIAASEDSVKAYFASLGMKYPGSEGPGGSGVGRAPTKLPQLAMLTADERKSSETFQPRADEGQQGLSPSPGQKDSNENGARRLSAQAQVLERSNPVARPVSWKNPPTDGVGMGGADTEAMDASDVAANDAGDAGELLAQAGGQPVFGPAIVKPGHPTVIIPLPKTAQAQPVVKPAATGATSQAQEGDSSDGGAQGSIVTPNPADILNLNSKFNGGSEGGSIEVKDSPAAAPQGGGKPAAFPKIPSITGNLSVPKEEGDGKLNVQGAQQNGGSQIPVTNSRNPKRGININSEHPSVRHVKMAPASKRWGGDEVEIVISPVYDVLIQMPDAIEFYRSSSALLTVSSVQTNLNLITLKLSPITNPAPISLHIVDVNQNIYTFSVVGTQADLAWEYPKTIVVSKRSSNRVKIGAANPRSIIDAMDVEDAIQIVVDDVPNSSEYQTEFVSGRYMDYEGYVMYGFRVSRKDKKKFERLADGRPNLKFTIWANGHRLDAGNPYASSREIEWTVEPILSKRETHRKGYEVLRVFVQLRADLLDLEEWTSAFITISNDAGYTRFDFPPLIRDFRAPVHVTGDEGEGEGEGQ